MRGNTRAVCEDGCLTYGTGEVPISLDAADAVSQEKKKEDLFHHNVTELWDFRRSCSKAVYSQCAKISPVNKDIYTFTPSYNFHRPVCSSSQGTKLRTGTSDKLGQ